MENSLNEFEDDFLLNELLTKAVENNEPENVKLRISQGANIHYRNGLAIIISCRDGNVDMVKFLLELGADVHAQEESSLDTAALHGRIDVVKLLIEAGANIHYDNDDILYQCTKNNQPDVIKILLEAGVNINNCKRSFLISCEKGYYHIAKLFIETCNNVASDNPDALIVAAQNGHTSVVRLLLESGADVHAAASKEIVALYNLFLLDFDITMMKSGKYFDNPRDCALLWSTYNGHIDVVKVLIEFGADIHLYDGDIILILAVNKGYIDIVKLFIDTSKFSQKTLNTALMRSFFSKRKDIFNFLLNSGANFKDIMLSAAESSAMCGELDNLKICVENGFDLASIANKLFNDAIIYDNPTILEYLLDSQIPFNVFDDNDDLLDGMVKSRNTDTIIHLLLKNDVISNTILDKLYEKAKIYNNTYLKELLDNHYRA